MTIGLGSIVKEKGGRGRTGVVLDSAAAKVQWIGSVAADTLTKTDVTEGGSVDYWRVVGEEISSNSGAFFLVKMLGSYLKLTSGATFKNTFRFTVNNGVNEMLLKPYLTAADPTASAEDNAKKWGVWLYYAFGYPPADSLPNARDWYAMNDFSNAANKLIPFAVTDKLLNFVFGGGSLTSFPVSKYVEAFTAFSASNYLQRWVYGVTSQKYRQP